MRQREAESERERGGGRRERNDTSESSVDKFCK